MLLHVTCEPEHMGSGLDSFPNHSAIDCYIPKMVYCNIWRHDMWSVVGAPRNVMPIPIIFMLTYLVHGETFVPTARRTLFIDPF